MSDLNIRYSNHSYTTPLNTNSTHSSVRGLGNADLAESLEDIANNMESNATVEIEDNFGEVTSYRLTPEELDELADLVRSQDGEIDQSMLLEIINDMDLDFPARPAILSIPVDSLEGVQSGMDSLGTQMDSMDAQMDQLEDYTRFYFDEDVSGLIEEYRELDEILTTEIRMIAEQVESGDDQYLDEYMARLSDLQNQVEDLEQRMTAANDQLVDVSAGDRTIPMQREDFNEAANTALAEIRQQYNHLHLYQEELLIHNNLGYQSENWTQQTIDLIAEAVSGGLNPFELPSESQWTNAQLLMQRAERAIEEAYHPDEVMDLLSRASLLVSGIENDMQNFHEGQQIGAEMGIELTRTVLHTVPIAGDALALGEAIAGRTIAGRTIAGRTIAGRTIAGRAMSGDERAQQAGMAALGLLVDAGSAFYIGSATNRMREAIDSGADVSDHFRDFVDMADSGLDARTLRMTSNYSNIQTGVNAVETAEDVTSSTLTGVMGYHSAEAQSHESALDTMGTSSEDAPFEVIEFE